MRFALTLFSLALIACPAATPPPAPAHPHIEPTPPTPRAKPPALGDVQIPTLRLPKLFMPASYTATLKIDPARTTFDGVIAISGDVTQRTPVIWLHGRDLQIKKATASKGGTTLALTVTPRGEELLQIAADPPLEPGTWVLGFEYSGKYDMINTAGAFKQSAAGSSYVYTQLEALYARRVFPCFDEPDSKVPWQLTLEVPSGMVAVSNTPVAKDTPLDTGGHRVEFARTKPLPSYLVAFGVGPFEIVDAGKTRSGVPVRIVTMKGRSAEAGYAAKTTARVLDLLEEWFAIRYPYEKLDMLVIPVTVGFSAMENVGLVTATESTILFDPHKPSWTNRRGYIGVAAHELAHQWFGDYVTMAWWDDIWLNEGFATWLGHKITTRFDAAWHDERGDLDIQTGALDADSIVSARKVRQPIAKIDDVYNAFDGITYTKGAAVLNTFEAYVGPDKFQAGVREYLKARAFGNATSAHFVAAISAAAGKDLAPAFATFLDQPGAPELEAKLVCAKGAPKLELVQQRFVAPGSPEPAAQPPWRLPVCVAYDRDGKRADACTLLEQDVGELALDAKACPRWIMPNANGRGYYRSRYTAQQVTTLRDEAWPQLSWTERRSLLFDVVSAARFRLRGMRKLTAKQPPSGKLPLALVISLVPKVLAAGDRFALSDALSVPLGVDRIIADDQRAKYEAWIRATFGPAAAKLGVTPRDSDDLDTESARADVVKAVAWTGRDPDLVKQCVELAAGWHELPVAIRGLVLMIAVDANPDLHAKILRDVKTEPDRARREEMFGALVATRDAKRVEAALELTLDPQIDIRESNFMLIATSSEATRKVAERFLRAHKDKLLERFPKEAVTGAIGYLAAIFTSSCDPALRDEALAYVTASFAKLTGAERVTKQSFEAMDQCIASRKLLEPELRAFFAGVKIPKPKDKPAKP